MEVSVGRGIDVPFPAPHDFQPALDSSVDLRTAPTRLGCVQLKTNRAGSQSAIDLRTTQRGARYHLVQRRHQSSQGQPTTFGVAALCRLKVDPQHTGSLVAVPGLVTELPRGLDLRKPFERLGQFSIDDRSVIGLKDVLESLLAGVSAGLAADNLGQRLALVGGAELVGQPSGQSILRPPFGAPRALVWRWDLHCCGVWRAPVALNWPALRMVLPRGRFAQTEMCSDWV